MSTITYPPSSAHQLGITLREVRRRLGLSRSHVAHSAGLTTRELAAYERGRVAIPVTDLSSLAGSCGVEVDELLGQRPADVDVPPRERSYPENPFAVLREVDTAQASVIDPVLGDEPDVVFWAPSAGGPVAYASPAPTTTEPAELAPITWRSDGTPRPRPTLGDLEHIDAEWRTGGIFPRAVASDEPALEHADAQWALVDARAPSDVRIEAIVDFSAGAGFGVLFHASLDEASRISGYSFEVDPTPGSGGYVLRWWNENREHWCPLSQAITTEPGRMFGRHTIDVQLLGDRLIVAVDGDAVLVIASLVAATTHLGLAPRTGSMIGMLSRANAEITVPAFRVARS